MKRDPLRTMLRIRNATLDEARKAVADAYARERDACARADAAAAALEHEMKAATSLIGGDEAVETFARWLPIGRGALAQARDAQRSATTELDRARVVLGLARTAVTTVESLIERRKAEERLEENRKEQLLLDEASRRPSDTSS